MLCSYFESVVLFKGFQYIETLTCSLDQGNRRKAAEICSIVLGDLKPCDFDFSLVSG